MSPAYDFVKELWNGGLNIPASHSLQALTERFYLRQLTELACNRFKWTGIPTDDPNWDIRPRYMELALYKSGLVVFFKHTDWNKYLCIQGVPNGQMDMYFDPTAFNLYGNGGTPGIDGKTVSVKDCVPIWSNMLRSPEHDVISIYVKRMSEFDRTIDINLMALRHPFVLAADDVTRQSVVEAFRQVQEGQPAIVVNKKGMQGQSVKDFIQVFDMKVDSELVTNLMVDKRKAWNEALTFLGINNSNQDKRERLVQSEVGANDSEVLMQRSIVLDQRRYACEQINKKFGVNIGVEWNTDIDSMADMPALLESNYPDDISNDAAEGVGV